MAYDEHMTPIPPAASPARAGTRTTLDKRMRVLAPNHTIVALGNYGYDWNGKRCRRPVLRGRGDRRPRFRRRRQLRCGHRQPAFLLCRGRRHQARRLVPRRRHRLQPDPRRRHLSAGGLRAVAAGQRGSLDLGGDGPRLWRRRAGQSRTYPDNDDIDFEGRGEILRVDAHPATVCASSTSTATPATSTTNAISGFRPAT